MNGIRGQHDSTAPRSPAHEITTVFCYGAFDQKQDSTDGEGPGQQHQHRVDEEALEEPF